MNKVLVKLLQNAYSGELAAIHAYRGHARSVRDTGEQVEIAKIGQEEADHRDQVGIILKKLGAQPRKPRELAMSFIGQSINLICRVGGIFNFFNLGWYASMYGAGRLEASNIMEYLTAARIAEQSGESSFVEPLLIMAEVEWDHENYFRQKCRESRWVYFIPLWKAPPDRERLRSIALGLSSETSRKDAQAEMRIS